MSTSPDRSLVVRDYDFNYGRTRGTHGFKTRYESQGDKINTMMQREMTKQSNLRARLKDLGFDQSQIDQCYVTAADDSSDDTVTIPWSVAYRAFNSTDGFAMGAA